jgi:hypothetical protein
MDPPQNMSDGNTSRRVSGKTAQNVENPEPNHTYVLSSFMALLVTPMEFFWASWELSHR